MPGPASVSRTWMESDETRTIVGVDDFGPGTATADGDRLVWHYVADYVNDFAWATSNQGR